MSTYRITCGDIELRRLTPRWASGIFMLAKEPDLSVHLSWPPHQTVDDTLGFISDTRRLWASGQLYNFGIFRTGPLEVLGCTGVHHVDAGNHRAEVGTWLGLPHQGQGLNLMVKGAIFGFAFGELSLHRIEMPIDVNNELSIHANRRLPGVIDEGIQHLRLDPGSGQVDARMLAITSQSYDAADYPPVEIHGTMP